MDEPASDFEFIEADSGAPARPPQPTRRDTGPSEAGTTSADTCRICRSEATQDEPLFYPCKCSGSIKFVHQECLMEWLGHSNKKHCELCKTPFRFTKLYDAQMPAVLPWGVFVKRACVHIVLGMGRAGRAALVGGVWLGLIPWFVRWVWRWLFWIADAAWAREGFVRIMLRSHLEAGDSEQSMHAGDWKDYIERVYAHTFQDPSGEPFSLRIAKAVFGFPTSNGNNTTAPPSDTFQWPQSDPSILSSWSHISNLTSSDRVNRFILDIFEGQLITCVVITGFILVFLIREWVVQQQPIVNLDNLNFVAAQEQLREAGDRMRVEADRMRQQQQLLDDARRRLEGLQRAADALGTEQFIGREGVVHLVEQGTEALKVIRRLGVWDDEAAQNTHEYGEFVYCAREIARQFHFADKEGVSTARLMNIVLRKISETEEGAVRKEWRKVLFREVEKLRTASDEEISSLQDDAEEYGESSRRPPLPPRDFSSRATTIQRLLEETDGQVKEAEKALEGVDAVAGTAQTPAVEENRDEAGASTSEATFDPTPITNAGPDAKVNIRRRGKGKMRAVPEPKLEIDRKMLDDDEALSKLRDEVNNEIAEEENQDKEEPSLSDQPARPQSERSRTNESNPFHPDGHIPAERRNSESFGNRVASVFREEFGLDEGEEYEDERPQEPRPDPDNDLPEGLVDAPRRVEAGPRGVWGRVKDWFWGDLDDGVVQQPPTPPADEERQGGEHAGGQPDDQQQEAPFVPIQNARPVFAAPAPDPQPEPLELPGDPAHDPEVLAAAQQAGLDPEAIEDAEDLEGIFELLGLQGPIIGLFQTSAFCMLLVAATILGAVIGPYMFGKLVLSLLGSPVYFLVKMPLRTASFVADLVVDVVVVGLSWVLMVAALAVEFIGAAVDGVWGFGWEGSGIIDKVVSFAMGLAGNAVTRLQGLTDLEEPVEGVSWSWAFLAWSVHAHASLRTIQEEVDAVMHCIGSAITTVVETISAGSVFAVCKRTLGMVTYLPQAPALLVHAFSFIQLQSQPLITFIADLLHGSIHLSTPTLPPDPSLVYWNTSDRALAITTGYAALAALAALYVAADTPLTTSDSGRRTEKTIRDALRQAGGVLKVILIISIEMLVFPLYCGMLLDLAFLPLFPEASVASRWAWVGTKPYTFCFVHWFVGTCYMFHFALFVGMCRKILRKGVLWFVRDPDDPTFHPVRDVLERNVATQLRKIAFSALVYGALVILCLGGVVWTTVQTCESVFPIHWASTEPVLEFPFNLFLYNFVTPLVFRLFKPTDAMSAMYAWWLRRCARGLRLSHFLFDDRRADEEGRYEYKSWIARFAGKKDDAVSQSDEETEVRFLRDGKYNLTPCSDQYRPPKPGEAFLHVDDEDVFIADKDGKKNDHWAKVYVPPLFRLRVSLFMGCLWLFSAIMGLCSTIVPLVVGRRVLSWLLPGVDGLNDIYAFTFGAYLLGGLLFAGLKGRAATTYIHSKARSIDAAVWLRRTASATAKTMKCLYVYGFLGIVVPIVFALLLQFYLVLPLHTWTVSIMSSETDVSLTNTDNTTTPTTNLTSLLLPSDENNTNPALPVSTFHILQGYALGLVYGRIALRLLFTAPATRAVEAFRRITATGYFDPNPRLATRFLILPFSLLSALLLLAPPLLAHVALSFLRTVQSDIGLEEATRTRVYRYSYPVAASCVVVALGLVELGRATRRWRARVRDEVYLVGERLHNFGERRPPVGTKGWVGGKTGGREVGMR